MTEIRLQNIDKEYGDQMVIHNLDVTIKSGSFTVLVGPSGCGKTTTLRMIAGLDSQTKGNIWIGDQCVSQQPPGKRDVAMVFQNYALYPTMTVKQNIEFGLVNRNVPKSEREKLIHDITEIVGLSPYLHKKPQQLSGGQRQRVALARAMVKKPKVFLMDEPLSNLDAKLRQQMRTELTQLHKRLGTTFIYVTHDQVEAMSMGDDIIIMDKGQVMQQGDPLTLYHEPTSIFVAQFIGMPPMNILSYEKLKHSNEKVGLEEMAHLGLGFVGFRPEKGIVCSEPMTNGLSIKGTVLARETLGSEYIYQINTSVGMLQVKSYVDPIIDTVDVFIGIPYEAIYMFNDDGEIIQKVKYTPKQLIGGLLL